MSDNESDPKKDRDVFIERFFAVSGERLLCAGSIAENAMIGITVETKLLLLIHDPDVGSIMAIPLAEGKLDIQKVQETIAHMMTHVDDEMLKKQMH